MYLKYLPDVLKVTLVVGERHDIFIRIFPASRTPTCIVRLAETSFPAESRAEAMYDEANEDMSV